MIFPMEVLPLALFVAVFASACGSGGGTAPCRKPGAVGGAEHGARTGVEGAKTGVKTAGEGIKTFGNSTAGLFEGGSDEAKKRWREGKAETKKTANEGAADTSAEAHAPPCK
jgi:hypothetical protein